MLAIAKEMNLSETSFVSTSDKSDFRARYFTPAEEIPLAGHPTIATIHVLVEAGRIDLAGESTKVSLELQVGPIAVEIIAREGVVEQIVMTQKKPQFMQIHDAELVMPVFGLTTDDALPDMPIQTVSTGTPQLMIAVKDHDVLQRIRMDHSAYLALRERSDFFSPTSSVWVVPRKRAIPLRAILVPHLTLWKTPSPVQQPVAWLPTYGNMV